MTIRHVLVAAPMNYKDQLAAKEAVRGVYMFPGATNGVRQAYDIQYDDSIALPPDPLVEVLGTRHEAILAYSFLRRWLYHVLVTTNDAPPLPPTRICPPGAMKAGASPETCQVLDAQGVQRTRTKAQLVTGDRPVAGQWWPAHEWLGRADDLGEDE